MVIPVVSIQVFYWPEKGPSTTPLLVPLTAKVDPMAVWYGWNNMLFWFRLWCSSAELSNRYSQSASLMQFAYSIIFFFFFFSQFLHPLFLSAPFFPSLKDVRCWLLGIFVVLLACTTRESPFLVCRLRSLKCYWILSHFTSSLPVSEVA